VKHACGRLWVDKTLGSVLFKKTLAGRCQGLNYWHVNWVTAHWSVTVM